MVPEMSSNATEDVLAEIARLKAELGERITILGHHYQPDEVIQFADYRGDSLGLSKQAAATSAPYIIFCGVVFMAETAAILCSAKQIVMQPAPEAFCPMARMTTARDAAIAWQTLQTVWGDDLIPITYQNSTAETKAFVGQHGGAVCTSANAEAIFKWAFARQGHILFMPDEHLGTNTALQMGIPLEEIGLWNPSSSASPETFADKRVVVWKGFCSVHQGMTVQDVMNARKTYPNARIVVHPECRHEVVALADASGSTTGIIAFVEESAPGSTIVVGTECNLVHRLDREYPDRTIVPLAERYCRTMGITTPQHLLNVLQGLVAGEPHNIVTVPQETAQWARLALERMLEAN